MKNDNILSIDFENLGYETNLCEGDSVTLTPESLVADVRGTSYTEKYRKLFEYCFTGNLKITCDDGIRGFTTTATEVILKRNDFSTGKYESVINCVCRIDGNTVTWSSFKYPGRPATFNVQISSPTPATSTTSDKKNDKKNNKESATSNGG